MAPFDGDRLKPGDARSRAPHPQIDGLLARCRSKPSIYTAREVEFLRSMAAKPSPCRTAAQIDWLQALADREPIDFDRINAAAMGALPAICKRWLPDGVLHGKEFVARNPTRADLRPGSFRINVGSGKWADFATGDKGGDPISLAAYIFYSGDRVAAATSLKRMLAL